MRTFRYVDQDGEHTVTEEEILKDFYPEWCKLMRKAGKEHLISEANCVDDYLVVHWAWEVEAQ